MKQLFVFIFLFVLISEVFSQVLTREDAIRQYSALTGATWETRGKWKSGADYHQTIVVETELTRNIFIVKTQDYIDSKKYDNARRNYGIRAWDNQEKKMKFWEFDVFGGITTGEVKFEGNNIYHIYQYPAKDGSIKWLADAWIYVDKNTYVFKVCEYDNGKLGKELLKSEYKRIGGI